MSFDDEPIIAPDADDSEEESDTFDKIARRLDDMDKSITNMKGPSVPKLNLMTMAEPTHTDDDPAPPETAFTDETSELAQTITSARLQEEVLALKSQLADSRKDMAALVPEAPGARTHIRFKQLEAELDLMRGKFLAERTRRETIETELNSLHSSFRDLRNSSDEADADNAARVASLEEEVSELQSHLRACRAAAVSAVLPVNPPQHRSASPDRESKERSPKEAARQPLSYVPSRIPLGKRPLVVCRLRREAVRTREKGPYTLIARAAETAGEELSLNVELDSGRSISMHRFDNVLDVDSGSQALADALTPVCAAALTGVPSAILQYSSHSTAAVDQKGSVVLALAQRFWNLLTEASERDATRWSLFLSCIELRSDIARDLLNTDRQYTRLQIEGRAGYIRHSIVATPSGPASHDCARPSIDSLASLKKLLHVAIGNRSVTNEGELRGHVFYVLTCQRRGSNGSAVRGSLVMADMACDCEFPVEAAKGAGESPSAVHNALDTRERERKSTRKSLAVVSDIFSNLAQPQRFASVSPNAERSEFPVGQKVEVTGLKAMDFLHMNGEGGTVIGRGEGEIAGRVIVRLEGAQKPLPFLPQNLIALDDHGRPVSASPQMRAVSDPRCITPRRHSSNSRRASASPVQVYSPAPRRAVAKGSGKNTRFSKAKGADAKKSDTTAPHTMPLNRPVVKVMLQAALGMSPFYGNLSIL